MQQTDGLLKTKIGFALTWYLAAVSTLVLSMLLLVYFSFPQKISASNVGGYQSYRALPGTLGEDNTLEVKISRGDARALIIDNFFKDRKSPMIGLGEEFVEAADRNGLDYRLLPSIAMQESNGGKKLPINSFNPFGYGIYGGKVLKFSSFAEAINKVAQGLKRDYINQGLQTPYEIMPKYTPPSLQKGGAWAIGVSAFMEQLL